MSLADRAVRLALSCYPAWWRERYEADQEALVEDLKAEQSRIGWGALGGWRLAGSFIVGAASARLSASGMPSAPELWQRRSGAASIAASVSAALAVPFAALLIGTAGEYGRSPTGSALSSMELSRAGQVAYWDVLALSLLSLACIAQLLAGVIRLSREMLSLAPPRRRALIVAAVLAPVVAIGAGFLMVHVSSSLRPIIGGSEQVRGHTVEVGYDRRGHPLVAGILYWTGWVSVVGGWVGGAVMLARMSFRRRFSLQALGDGASRARAVTLVQTGMAACALVLVATVPLQEPIGPTGGMIYRSDLGPWMPVVCVTLLVVTVFSWVATRVARQAITHVV